MKIKELLLRYKAFLVILFVNIALLIFTPELGKEAFSMTGSNIMEMVKVLPPIFIILGLLDVWVEKETMMKYLGHGSGFKGIFISFMLGAVAAGPLYAAFPVAGIMLKKGAKLSNVFILIGAWSTAKIPLLLFEVTSLGAKFTLIRLAMSIIGILLIAYALEKTTSEEEKQAIYDNANAL